MNVPSTQNGSTGSTAVATKNNQADFFKQYGDQASKRSIVGRLMKFSKGDFLVGEANAEMKRGTELVANMDELMVGWIKWADNKPVEQIMGRVVEGYQPPKRKELDEQDETTWEIDEATRQPRDPWQLSNYLIMKTPGENDPDDALFTFTTASKGGLGAIGELCKAYSKHMRQKPDEFPIVKIDVGSYEHSNKALGRIKFPIFEVIGWVPNTDFAEILGQAAANDTQSDSDKDIPF